MVLVAGSYDQQLDYPAAKTPYYLESAVWKDTGCYIHPQDDIDEYKQQTFKAGRSCETLVQLLPFRRFAKMLPIWALQQFIDLAETPRIWGPLALSPFVRSPP